LAKVAVQYSADTFVVKIPAFAKLETVSRNCEIILKKTGVSQDEMDVRDYTMQAFFS